MGVGYYKSVFSITFPHHRLYRYFLIVAKRVLKYETYTDAVV